MNKSGFIKEIAQKLQCDEERSIAIESIVGDHFIIGKNNKEKVIIDLMEKLGMDREEADKTYNTVSEIIANALKDRIIHPFRKEWFSPKL